MSEIATRVAGIPCIARVTYLRRQPPWRGSPQTCDSDIDFYGYDECEFEILDQRGRPAPWLAKKLTEAEGERITEEILKKVGG